MLISMHRHQSAADKSGDQDRVNNHFPPIPR